MVRAKKQWDYDQSKDTLVATDWNRPLTEKERDELIKKQGVQNPFQRKGAKDKTDPSKGVKDI